MKLLIIQSSPASHHFLPLPHRCVQTGSAAHSAFYPMGTG